MPGVPRPGGGRGDKESTAHGPQRTLGCSIRETVIHGPSHLCAMRFWLGVVSREHAMAGVAGGFAQLCHGKAAPIVRMEPGDYLIYYSSKLHYEGSKKAAAASGSAKNKMGSSVGGTIRGTKDNVYQRFTAIGRISHGESYKVGTAQRREVEFLHVAHELPMSDIKGSLDVAKAAGANWGLWLYRGVLELGPDDFLRIARGMVSVKVFARIERDVSQGTMRGETRTPVCATRPEPATANDEPLAWTHLDTENSVAVGGVAAVKEEPSAGLPDVKPAAVKDEPTAGTRGGRPATKRESRVRSAPAKEEASTAAPSSAAASSTVKGRSVRKRSASSEPGIESWGGRTRSVRSAKRTRR